ncbi:MAG: cell division protein FtsZ [Alphaproteobacteria bacterium]|jgi:cell division protein FtsZ|nr:cell division protein FtsZ [Alphaproteobacteria bacterium]
MAINFSSLPMGQPELKPRIVVIGVGGAGGNAVNNMIQSGLEGVEFVVANTDAQALSQSKTNRRIQLGVGTTQGLGAGSRPDIGRAAAEEAMEEILAEISGSNMAFITAGMGGGTGTGAAGVIARAAREQGILTVGVITKPFTFEGHHRMRLADTGIEELAAIVDTLIIIPNQNLFRVANQKTTFAEAFKMADDVLCSGVRGVTDLMVVPGLINLDFADIRTVMGEMGKAHMGTGEATGERRALDAAEAAISNPLLDDTSMSGARGVLINITGGSDLTLFEVDEAANRIRGEADPDANIIFGSTFDDALEGRIRISVVATGIEAEGAIKGKPSVFDFIASREQRQGSEPQAQPQPVVHTSVAPPVAVAQPQHEPLQVQTRTTVTMSRPAEPMRTALQHSLDIIADAPSQQMGQASTVEPHFIPQAPAKLEDAPAHQADPFAEAAMVNGAGQSKARTAEDRLPDMLRPDSAKDAKQAKRPASLFGLVTGAVKRTPAQPAPAPAPAPQMGLIQTSQPRLGGLDPQDRPALSKGDEDALDIPTFLRRQAN